MAKKIYIGEILGQVNSAIAALQVDMGTMSGDMANVVNELINVKAAVASGTNEISVRAGNDFILTLNDTEKVASGYGVLVPVASFISQATGSVLLSCEIRGTQVYSHVMNISKDGGTPITIIDASSTPTTYTAETVILPVVKGSTYTIGLQTSGGYASLFYLKAGATIGYQLNDIINNNAINIL
ncbi:MAG: hypothetical protein RBR68_13555 [Tenuifilaceae bacterium]|nr:hypothetical protein [Tenuifilaceae bacterium]